VTRSVVVRKDEDVLRELIDTTLTTTRPDGSSETREIAEDELGEILRDVFGLELHAEELDTLARRFIAAP
jgi:hypothetical protein